MTTDTILRARVEERVDARDKVTGRVLPRLIICQFDRHFHFPFRLARLDFGIGEIGLVPRTKGIPLLIIPAVPGNAVGFGPFDQDFIARVAITHVHQTGITTRRKQCS